MDTAGTLEPCPSSLRKLARDAQERPLLLGKPRLVFQGVYIGAVLVQDAGIGGQDLVGAGKSGEDLAHPLGSQAEGQHAGADQYGSQALGRPMVRPPMRMIRSTDSLPPASPHNSGSPASQAVGDDRDRWIDLPTLDGFAQALRSQANVLPPVVGEFQQVLARV